MSAWRSWRSTNDSSWISRTRSRRLTALFRGGFWYSGASNSERTDSRFVGAGPCSSSTETYSLRPSRNTCAIRVASPSSIGRQPVTFGSSVPAWAARSTVSPSGAMSATAPAARSRTQPATWWADGPAGLSRLSTPNASSSSTERSAGAARSGSVIGRNTLKIVDDAFDRLFALIGARTVGLDSGCQHVLHR